MVEEFILLANVANYFYRDTNSMVEEFMLLANVANYFYRDTNSMVEEFMLLANVATAEKTFQPWNLCPCKNN
jgi:exoribonuclease R